MGRLDLPDPRRDEDSADAPLRAVSESGDDRAAAEFYEWYGRKIEYRGEWHAIANIDTNGVWLISLERRDPLPFLSDLDARIWKPAA